MTTVRISNLCVTAGEIGMRLCIVLATLWPTRDDDDGLATVRVYTSGDSDVCDSLAGIEHGGKMGEDDLISARFGG